MIIKLRRTFLISTGLFVILIILYVAVLSSLQLRESINTSCSKTLYPVHYNEAGYFDEVSQWRKVGPTTYVFSAYLDDRKPCSTLVTVLGFGEKSDPPLYGTLVFQNGATIKLKTSDERAVLNPYGTYSNDRLGPYAFSWTLPSEARVPAELNAIVIHQDSGDKASHLEAEIPIKFPIYSTKIFGVCTDSQLFGSVKSKSVLESIEVNRILGAEWFTIYVYNVGKDILRLLQVYVTEGIAEVIRLWGTDIPRSVHYYGQTLSINECAYRNMFRVKYLVYIDLDEFIVPRKSLSWRSMMDDLEKSDYATYVFQHVFFRNKKDGKDVKNLTAIDFSCNRSRGYMDWPRFLSHTYRSQKVYPSRVRSKYIIKPSLTDRVGVHEVFKHFNETLHAYIVPAETALLHHYRSFERNDISVSLQDELHDANLLLDERTLVFKSKIVNELKKRICKNLHILDETVIRRTKTT